VQVSNHPKLRWLKTVVVSVGEKPHMMRQVWAEKANESEPLMTCRKAEMTSKPGP
jgi:hypothetical protein